jgi:GTP-binding protein LepA
MDSSRIRNFSIIAHIDHGKSTLADRMLEITGAVDRRQMRDQVLDTMDLERERGITIKIAPVSIKFTREDEIYSLNLIDTPGHIDFAYEVSRALSAVEGSILLVDCTQGVQAQTLSTLNMAREVGLVIIPVLSKVDSPNARIEEVKSEVSKLLNCDKGNILMSSGKTGEGVRGVLEAIVDKIQPPAEPETDELKALVFDFKYSTHKGVVVFTRVVGGQIGKGDAISFAEAKQSFTVLEVGILNPQEKPVESLREGEIGYVVTGIKKAGVVSVGDTLIKRGTSTKPLAGYKTPLPVVWASIYPESQDQFETLRLSLEALKLSDASLSFEEESSGSLGRGFRCGFLGILHLEIVSERLRREFSLELVITTPSITYEVEDGSRRYKVYSGNRFPDHGSNATVYEQMIEASLITPAEYVSSLTRLLYEHEAVVESSEQFGDDRMIYMFQMPLRELMRNFFDKLKNVSSGYASLSYEIKGTQKADVAKIDVYVADKIVPALSRVVARARIQEEAKRLVEKLHKTLPKQLFVTNIQAHALGRVVSAKKLSALRKDVTGHLYGGDVTRKKKLLEKQKKGKKKMKEKGIVTIPHEVFLAVMKQD